MRLRRRPDSIWNRYLYPGLALMGGGATMALVGFLHTTRHPTDPTLLDGQVLAGNPYLSEQLLLSMGYSTRNTALGVAGIGVAGVGGALFAIGREHKETGGPKLSFGPAGAIAASWSSTF